MEEHESCSCKNSTKKLTKLAHPTKKPEQKKTKKIVKKKKKKIDLESYRGHPPMVIVPFK